MEGNRQVAKCRILKRFGENFVKNVGKGVGVVGLENFKFGFIGLFIEENRFLWRATTWGRPYMSRYSKQTPEKLLSNNEMCL
jgi:hypothetical protein